jgi:hypothetical protein
MRSGLLKFLGSARVEHQGVTLENENGTADGFGGGSFHLLRRFTIRLYFIRKRSQRINCRGFVKIACTKSAQLKRRPE